MIIRSHRLLINISLINMALPKKTSIARDRLSQLALVFCALACLVPFASQAAWNNPYPAADSDKNILYSAFTERPKHLDPVRSYTTSENVFLAQIYEPPFEYHYFKRPYVLEPLTVETMPQPQYRDRQGRPLAATASASQIAYSVYTLRVRPGIRYQPHPSLALGEKGQARYLDLSPEQLAQIQDLDDFAHSGTRELVAADYVYQIKRLANLKLHSPLHGPMSEIIVGFADYSKQLQQWYKDNGDDVYLDLTQYPMRGVKLIDRYTYQITINGKNPQFLYWMAMPFFAPMPPEAERFFSQAGMKQKNLTLDWYAVGTGPYMLTVNNPNRQIVLERNPNYHPDFYPSEGEPGDAAKGLLADAGKPLPFIDKIIFSLEKESIPYWNKFMQGYYDKSGISSESFDQSVRVGSGGEVALTQEMQDKGIGLLTSVETSIFYYAFNMRDKVVGGDGEKQRKLRQAISIALDMEEMISIFRNGRGIAAQGPIPPGIFGHQEGKAGINPYVYDWVNGRTQRKSIDVAKRLLAEAGYPNARDIKTGKPLILYYDSSGTGPGSKDMQRWLIKQLKKLNIDLVIRNTDYNRFQDKVYKGTVQIFGWGWNADYPDPENFLFLLYGPNSTVDTAGVNHANYDSPQFNRLFERMKSMDNGPARQKIIDQMLEIARRDAPWAWGFNPKSYTLQHRWVYNSKPNLMARYTLKYARIDPVMRAKLRAQWNPPVLWPIALLLLVLTASLVPAFIVYRRKERQVRR